MTTAQVEANSKCWCFTGSKAQSVIAYLLNEIEGSGMTKEQVEANSKCWCFTGSTFERVVAYLLAQIEAGGGGGATNPVEEQALGGASPVAASKNFVLDTDTDFLWYSSTKAAPWINV